MVESVLKWSLSLLVLAGFFYLGFYIVSGQVKTSDANMLLLIGSVFGAASTYTGIVINYQFGSTKASADKDKTISNMVANIPVSPSTVVTTTAGEPPTSTTVNVTKTPEKKP